MTKVLLLATFLVPIGMLVACLWPGPRARMPGLLALAPLPGLLAALFAQGEPSVTVFVDWLRLGVALDGSSALLLGVAALLWSAAGAYAGAYISDGRTRFAVWWLLTLTGSLGVFVAEDLLSFYLAFALVSLAAYGLVIHEGTQRAHRAGSTYLLLAVLGEVCLLLGFVLLAVGTPGPSIAIRDVVAALPTSPVRDAAVGALILGFGLKAGLVPLHVWLPLAHPAAPMPASAVLSGAIIKAGIIGLIRFLPFESGLAEWGVALGVLGLGTAFYGVAFGVTHANPKTILAYSSVSQMGVVMAALGFGLALADGTAPLAAAFYAAHHVLAKGALFLAVGVAAALGPARWRWVVVPVLLLVLSFGGLPFTGGALAKAATKGQLGEGVLGWLAAFSAAGTTLLMLHFAGRLKATVSEAPAGPALPWAMMLPWLLLTAAAVLLPWVLFVPIGAGTLADVVAPAKLWGALWPVALGGALLLALRRAEARLPRPPEGDVLLLAERGFARVAAPIGVAADRMDARLRTWPSAALVLLMAVLLLSGAMLAR